jgi:hypothetical protein
VNKKLRDENDALHAIIETNKSTDHVYDNYHGYSEFIDECICFCLLRLHCHQNDQYHEQDQFSNPIGMAIIIREWNGKHLPLKSTIVQFIVH